MELAGEVLQELCAALSVTELESVADFPQAPAAQASTKAYGQADVQARVQRTRPRRRLLACSRSRPRLRPSSWALARPKLPLFARVLGHFFGILTVEGSALDSASRASCCALVAIQRGLTDLRSSFCRCR
eukprot:6173976-Pleurochrysis_carterae.AAC.6